MKLYLYQNIVVENPPPGLSQAIQERFTFPNPVYLDNERMGRYNGQTERYLRVWRRSGGSLLVPRGAFPTVIGLCKQHNVRFQIDDRRRTLPAVDFRFAGTLREYQKEAAAAMLQRDSGVLVAPTGSGKTIMACSLIAERRQPTLVVVHTRELADQWTERVSEFLGIPKSEIGRIGGGKLSVGNVTIATVQSVVKHAEKVVPYFGYLIVDECHHTPSRTFTDVVSSFDCKYTTGLSATPWRRDGLSRLIYWFLGNAQHKIERAELVETGAILAFDVVVRETEFQTTFDPSEDYSSMLSQLTEDEDRNRLIVDAILNSPRRGVSLVLVDRKRHAETLHSLLRLRGFDCEVLTGDYSASQRQNTVEKLAQGRTKALIATSHLVGEGFDCPSLSTLFLATPMKFNGRVLQALGRVLRPAQDKARAVVVDFVDSKVGVLKAAADSRQRTYARVT